MPQIWVTDWRAATGEDSRLWASPPWTAREREMETSRAPHPARSSPRADHGAQNRVNGSSRERLCMLARDQEQFDLERVCWISDWLGEVVSTTAIGGFALSFW
jgi:hypothetical protein